MKKLILITILNIFILNPLIADIKSLEYFERARNYYTEGNYEKAIKYFEKGLEINPDTNINARQTWGVCLNLAAYNNYETGNYKKALPYLKKLHKLDPKNTEIEIMYQDA